MSLKVSLRWPLRHVSKDNVGCFAVYLERSTENTVLYTRRSVSLILLLRVVKGCERRVSVSRRFQKACMH